jgi:hypothetical protein
MFFQARSGSCVYNIAISTYHIHYSEIFGECMITSTCPACVNHGGWKVYNWRLSVTLLIFTLD